MVGAEYRGKPDNLRFACEQGAYDLFGAWQSTRHVAVTVAYANLGNIAMVRRQCGAFLSIQGGL